MEPVLCYVSGCWAYFTTQPLSKQWGDDWNDAPYEHNAGHPYYYDEHDKKAGKEQWEIIEVAFQADLITPKSDYLNSPFSVKQINAGAVAWLRSDQYHRGEIIVIPAGTTLAKFRELINKSGGKVYEHQANA